MTKTSEAVQFSNIVDLVHKWGYYRNQYLAAQNELIMGYEDHLAFIKEHLFAGDEDDFSDFDRYDFGRRKYPTEKIDFDSESEDNFLDQFDQIQNVSTPCLLTGLNHQQTSVFIQLTRIYSSGPGPDLTFSLVSIKKILLIRNEAKLILSILYVLVFWFDFGILDLHQVFSFFHDYLSKKSRERNRINLVRYNLNLPHSRCSRSLPKTSRF